MLNKSEKSLMLFITMTALVIVTLVSCGYKTVVPEDEDEDDEK